MTVRKERKEKDRKKAKGELRNALRKLDVCSQS